MLYFIVNYHGGSGNAKRTWNQVHDVLHARDIAYKSYVTKKAGDGKMLAEKICQEIEEKRAQEEVKFAESGLPEEYALPKLIVVGGDGTINEVLNGMSGFDNILFGVIPTGSGNDFPRGIGTSKKDTLECLEHILTDNRGKKIDLGQVTWYGEDGEKVGDKIFGVSSGIGLDAIVCKKAETSKIKKILNKFRMGNLTYPILTVTSLFSMKTYHANIKFLDGDGESQQNISYRKMIFLAAMNFSAEGGGVPMSPGAEPDDGKLSIFAVSEIPKWRTFTLFPILLKGKHVGHKGFFLKDVTELSIEAEEPMVLHTDGEYVADVQKADFRVLPQILNLLADI